MATVDEYVNGLPDEQQAVARRLVGLIDAALPDVPAVVWHGHPVWKDGATPVAGFKAFPRWVSLLIWDGAAAADTSGTLGSSAAGMGTARIASPDELDDTVVSGWLASVATVRASG